MSEASSSEPASTAAKQCVDQGGHEQFQFVGGPFCPLMHAFEAWHPLHVCALRTDPSTSMATDIAACGAYLAVGQLLRRSGLIQDSDTQARRHAHAAVNPLDMHFRHQRSAEQSHGSLKSLRIMSAGCSRSGAVCHAAVSRTAGAAADASGSGDRGQGNWLWCCRLSGGRSCQLVSCLTSDPYTAWIQVCMGLCGRLNAAVHCCTG